MQWSGLTIMMHEHCPICGVYVISGPHKCSQRSLDAIDRMRKSDHDFSLDDRRTEAQRLNEGFRMLSDEYED
jgi:hypothetical protein